jgi:hypothetical protein
MKRSFRSALLALPLPLALAAAPAYGLATDRQYDIRIEGSPVGLMTFRNRVTQDRAGVKCQYTGRWTGQFGPLARTRVCKLEEFMASDHFDCEANRRGFFPTIVSAPEGGCDGFDEFGQATDISTLVAGESPGGELFGIIVTDSIGDVQSFEMTAPPNPVEPQPLPAAPSGPWKLEQPITQKPILILG